MNHHILILKIRIHCLSEIQISRDILFFIWQAEVLTTFGTQSGSPSVEANAVSQSVMTHVCASPCSSGHIWQPLSCVILIIPLRWGDQAILSAFSRWRRKDTERCRMLVSVEQRAEKRTEAGVQLRLTSPSLRASSRRQP